MRTVVRFALVSAVAVISGYLIRRTINRWGATDEELAGALPGDELVTDPQLRSTRAITIRAPVDRVFPWLAQVGQGRGGFYSYDWLENRVGLDIHSAEHILPEFQQPKPGEQIRMAPGPQFYGLLVADVAAPTRLVLQMRIHPFTGLQIEPGPPTAGPSVHASWAFTLKPIDDASTRLISRNRAHLRLPFGLWLPYSLALEAIEFVMERRMLLGIRERAERTNSAPSRALSPGCD